MQKITDGELNVLNVLWENGEMFAADIVKALKTNKNWNKNTTYTFINRLVEKTIIQRTEPNFLCKAIYTKEQVALSESESFLKKMFNGSLNLMITNFLESENLSEKELEEIAELINDRRK